MAYMFQNLMNTVNMPQADRHDWLALGLHCRTLNSL